jgi:lipooligosaccharide transport system permease protein
MTMVAPARMLWSRYFMTEMKRYQRTWRASTMSNILYPVLYLASMGLGVGHLVASHHHLVAGTTYLKYIAPGLVAVAATQTAAAECMWPVLGGVMWEKTYCVAITSPLRTLDIVRGRLAYVAARVAIISVINVAVVGAFGALDSIWAILLPLISVLTGLSIAAPVFAYSAQVTSDSKFAIIQRFFIMPMSLFSATFYPLSAYPHWLRPLVEIMPLYHAVVLSRAATTGHGDVMLLIMHAGVLVALASIGLWWAQRNLIRRLDPR